MKDVVRSWPALIVLEVLVECVADPLRDAAGDLPLDDHRVDHLAAVLDHDVAHEA